jgi:hypothetical protein
LLGVQVPGGKGLVLDPKLSGPLGLIAEVSLLKEHGVEKIYHLSDRLDTDCKNIVYLIRPRYRVALSLSLSCVSCVRVYRA